MLDLGIANNVAKPLYKRTINGKNIKDVYAGDNHIWPVTREVIYFTDFDSLLVRFIWTDENGKDFDTGTYITNMKPDIDDAPVGWSQGGNDIMRPYLYWGGDNMLSGGECVMINTGAIKRDIEASKIPATTIIKLMGNWYNTRKNGNFTALCTAYKGGVIVKTYTVSGKMVKDTSNYYAFADMNGNLPNNYKIYEAYKTTKDGVNTYHKVNMVDDSIEGMPNLKIKRTFNVNSVDYVSEDGKVTVEFRYELKVWNGLINYEAGKKEPIRQSKVKVHDKTNDNEVGDLVVVLESPDEELKTYLELTYASTVSLDGQYYSHLFGFVAGGGEERGQLSLNCNVTSTNKEKAAEPFAVINYFNRSSSGNIMSLNPIEDGVEQ